MPPENDLNLDLPALFKNFLAQRAAAWQAGEGAEESGEVTPYQSGGVQIIDDRQAAQEAVIAAELLLNQKQFLNKSAIPPGWANLVRSQPTAAAVSFAVGNYPQLVADMKPLLEGRWTHHAKKSASAGDAEFAEWTRTRIANKNCTEAVVGIGVLRLAGQFDAARECLSALRRIAPNYGNDFLLNEEAALAWEQGERDAAAKQWADHPHQTNPVIQFNRGLAALSHGETDRACMFFNAAAPGIDERSGWHHLARLYALVAEAD